MRKLRVVLAVLAAMLLSFGIIACTGDVVPTGIQLNTAAHTIEVGETYQLVPTVAPEGVTAAVTWTSSDPGKATVDANGVVTGVAAGKTTVTAKVGDVSASAEITVVEKSVPVDVESVTIAYTTPTIYIGDTFTLKSDVAPSNATDKTIAWSSSAEGVATVSGGVVTAVSAGTATITATAGGKSATATVKVVAAGTPIAISTAADFDMLVRNNLSGVYYLTNDIDFDGASVRPIGDQELTMPDGTIHGNDWNNDPNRVVLNGWKGVFDGRGYSLIDFKILVGPANGEKTSYNNALFPGLFGGTIRNLSIKGVSQVLGEGVSDISRASLLVNTLYAGVIENVYIEGTISNLRDVADTWRYGGTVFGRHGDKNALGIDTNPERPPFIVRNVVTNVTSAGTAKGTRKDFVYPVAGHLDGTYDAASMVVENLFIINDGLSQAKLTATNDTRAKNANVFALANAASQDYSALNQYFWDTSEGLPKLRNLTAAFKQGDVTVTGNDLTGTGYTVAGDAAVGFEESYAFSVTLDANFREIEADSITVAYTIGNESKTIKAKSESAGEYTFVIPGAYDDITITGVTGITEYFDVVKAGKDGNADMLLRFALGGTTTVNKEAEFAFTVRINEGNTAAADGISTNRDENLYVAYKIGDGSEVVLLDDTMSGTDRVEPDGSGYYHFTVPAGVVTDDLVIVVGGIEKILGFYDIDLYDGGELFTMTGNNNDPSATGADEDKASAVFDYTVIIEIDSAKAVKVGDIVISFTVNEGLPSEANLTATAVAGDNSGETDYTGKWIATIHADDISGPIVVTGVSGIYKIEEVEFADDSSADYTFAGAFEANSGENYEFTVTMDAAGKVPVVVYTVDGETKSAEFVESNGLEFTFSIPKEDILGKVEIDVDSVKTYNSVGVSTFGKADNFELDLTTTDSIAIAWGDIIDIGILTGITYSFETLDGDVSMNNGLVVTVGEGTVAGDIVSIRVWLYRDGSIIAYTDITVSFVANYDDYTGWTAISNAAEFDAIASNLNGKYYLTANIDFVGATRTPIGGTGGDGVLHSPETGGDPFTGIFDGRGFTLSNYKMSGNNADQVSLFGWLGHGDLDPAIGDAGQNGVIRNLKVTGAELTANGSNWRAGALVGRNHGLIENVYIEAAFSTVNGAGVIAAVCEGGRGFIRNSIAVGKTLTGNTGGINALTRWGVRGENNFYMAAPGVTMTVAGGNNEFTGATEVTDANIGGIDFSMLPGAYWADNVAEDATSLPKLRCPDPSPALTVSVQSTLALVVGEQKLLSATVNAGALTSKKVVWSVTGGDAVTVSANGLVAAVKAGTATVTATIYKADGTPVTADCTVTVTDEPILVENIIFNRSEATIYALSATGSDKVTISANVLPKSANNKNLIWTTNNPAVAQVSSAGQVTAISAGTATVTASSQDGSLISASAEITVEVANDWTPIATPEEFKAALNNSTRTGAYYLTADIDFEGEAIATIAGNSKKNAFRGVFDGRGHTIKNFKTAPTTGGDANYDAALFAGLGAGGVIRNVMVTGAEILSTANRSGILVGTLHGGTVENVYLEGTVGTNEAENWTRAGLAFGGTDGSPTGENSGKVTIRNVVVKPTGFRGISTAANTDTYRLLLGLQNGTGYNDSNYLEIVNFYGMTDIVTGTLSPIAGSNNNVTKTNIRDFESADIGSEDFSKLPGDFWEGNVKSGATELPKLKVLGGIAESIALDKDNLALNLHDTFTFTPILDESPAMNSTTWISTDPTVATVTQSGTVLAMSEGTTQIIASIGTDAAVCDVTVGPIFTSKDITAFNWNKPKDPASAPYAAPTVEGDGSLKFTTNAVAPVFDPAVTRTPINTLGMAGATSNESTASFMLKTADSFTIPFLGGDGSVSASAINNILMLRYNGTALQIVRSVGGTTADLVGGGSLTAGTVVGSIKTASAGFTVGDWNRVDIVVSAMAANIGSAAGNSVTINDSITANGDGLVVTKIYINGELVIWQKGSDGTDVNTTYTATASTDGHAAAVIDGVWYQRRCSATVTPTSNPGRYGIGLAFVPAGGNPIYVKHAHDWVSVDAGDHTCDICDETEAHNLTDGACDECDYQCAHDYGLDGVCVDCGYDITEDYDTETFTAGTAPGGLTSDDSSYSFDGLYLGAADGTDISGMDEVTVEFNYGAMADGTLYTRAFKVEQIAGDSGTAGLLIFESAGYGADGFSGGYWDLLGNFEAMDNDGTWASEMQAFYTNAAGAYDGYWSQVFGNTKSGTSFTELPCVFYATEPGVYLITVDVIDLSATALGDDVVVAGSYTLCIIVEAAV